MKQHWQRMALKIDALSLRERAIIFGMAALILIVLVNSALLEPQYAKQKQLTQRIKQEQSKTAGMQAQIQQKMALQQVDPDQADKARLQELQRQSADMRLALHDLHSGLVPPDRMSSLLEEMLRKNDALRLVSLKTLPAAPLTEPANMQDKLIEAVTGSARDKPELKLDGIAADTVYKHGVEIVVQGGYLDLMHYLTQLEAMPWRLLWGKAKLSTDEYPRSTLTLTLFTLSLDRKWLNL